jgi:hypothetical protein
MKLLEPQRHRDTENSTEEMQSDSLCVSVSLW